MSQDVESGSKQTRAGMVTVVGRPNVGKSTLMNRLLGQKVSITSPKAQTTRHQILGILTNGPDQVVFVDTPGLMSKRSSVLDKYMTRVTLQNIGNVDGIVFVVEALRWNEADDHVVEQLRNCTCPIILCVNKVDLVAEKALLLPYMDKVQTILPFHAIVPVSARNRDNLRRLEQCVLELLKPGAHLFDEDQVTDRSERFLASEVVREKLLRRLDQEVPHKLSVVVDQFSEAADMVHIAVTIWVERESQKGIVIGAQGQILKAIGEQSRTELERMLGKRVFLQSWVKVRENWSNDEQALHQLGYDL